MGIITYFKFMYASFKKKKVDSIVGENLSKNSDNIIFAIHGTRMNYYNSFFYLLRCITDIPIIPLDYNCNDSIENICSEVSLKIKKIISGKEYGKIAIIGHSFGGVVARLLLDSYFSDQSRFVLCTIATPNKGLDKASMSWLKKLIFKTIGSHKAEMKGSRTLKKLNNKPLLNAKVITVLGEKDYWLEPSDSDIHGASNKHIPREGHLSILYSRELPKILVGAI